MNKVFQCFTKDFDDEKKIIDNYQISLVDIYRRLFSYLVDFFIINLILNIVFAMLFWGDLKINTDKINLNNNDKIENIKIVNNNDSNKENKKEEFFQKHKSKIKKYYHCRFLFPIIYILLATYFWSASLGQKAFGLKIVSKNNNGLLTKKDLINRAIFFSALLNITSNFLIFLVINVAPVLLMYGKASLIDALTKTKIVYVKRLCQDT